jgi:hypothetical protein
MKRKIILLVGTFLFISFSIHAQLGLQIGYNMAKMIGAEVPVGASEKYLGNISGGAFFEKDIIPFLDIRIGVMYSPKGMRWEVDNDNSLKATLNYIEVPVLAKIKIGPVYALGGAYGAYALNGKSKFTAAGIETKTDIDFDADEIKRFDYGLKFGLGAQAGLGPIHLFAQVEYTFGLQNINDGQGDEMKNSVIGASAGVLIGF